MNKIIAPQVAFNCGIFLTVIETQREALADTGQYETNGNEEVAVLEVVLYLWNPCGVGEKQPCSLFSDLYTCAGAHICTPTHKINLKINKKLNIFKVSVDYYTCFSSHHNFGEMDIPIFYCFSHTLIIAMYILLLNNY